MYQDIQSKLGYTFRDTTLLVEALTHRSFLATGSDIKTSHNERLEFLGDAVLGLVVSESIADTFPQCSEGELSKIKAGLISRAPLARAARRIDVGQWLRLGRGEEATRGREKPSLLANALEAILGAVYLDGGIGAARLVILRILASEFDNIKHGPSSFIGRDWKTRLQEWAHQRRQGANPLYRVVHESGPDHEKVFRIEVVLNGQVLGSGEGRTKKEAEQLAAQQALKGIETPGRG